MLRVYWYDGAPDAIPLSDHLAIAKLTNVKLRLGRLTRGEQKGVDWLIIRDLMTLARERAIATALLVSGDEDLREGRSQPRCARTPRLHQTGQHHYGPARRRSRVSPTIHCDTDLSPLNLKREQHGKWQHAQSSNRAARRPLNLPARSAGRSFSRPERLNSPHQQRPREEND
jgi:hypothetical protein